MDPDSIASRIASAIQAAVAHLTTRHYLLAASLLVLLALFYALSLVPAIQSTPTPTSTQTSMPSPAAIAQTSTPPAPSATPTTVATPTSAPTSTPTSTSTSTPTVTPTPTPVPPTAVPTPANFAREFNFQPLAIMVENHPDARPQSGLSEADVVYEIVTEGGITRFMAIYGNRKADVVGPVRSARHYFVYLAKEYNAIYGHAGASPQGYDAIKAVGLTTVDNSYGEGGYWRVSQREAPHNLYTSTAGIWDWVKPGGTGQLAGLRFKVDRPQPSVSRITVTYPNSYTVAYNYVPATNSYLRYMEGEPHVDGHTGVHYNAKNVVVQVVETWRITGDDAGRMDMQIVGKGTAYIFVDGRAIKGQWVKSSLNDVTRFVDANGEPVLLNAGQTWIQVVATEGKIAYE